MMRNPWKEYVSINLLDFFFGIKLYFIMEQAQSMLAIFSMHELWEI